MAKVKDIGRVVEKVQLVVDIRQERGLSREAERKFIHLMRIGIVYNTQLIKDADAPPEAESVILPPETELSPVASELLLKLEKEADNLLRLLDIPYVSGPGQPQ